MEETLSGLARLIQFFIPTIARFGKSFDYRSVTVCAFVLIHSGRGKRLVPSLQRLSQLCRVSMVSIRRLLQAPLAAVFLLTEVVSSRSQTGCNRRLTPVLCRILARQESGHVRPAYRAGALGHSPTFIGLLDAAILDLSLLATFDTVAFEFHGEASSLDVGWM